MTVGLRNLHHLQFLYIRALHLRPLLVAAAMDW